MPEHPKPAMRVKVLVLPVYRRTWLYHAWPEGLPEPPTEAWWKAGNSLQDKASALSQQLNSKVNHFVSDQWALNAAAKEGTFRHWMHRLALGVMSREDPIETFLKKLPRHDAKQPMSLEVMYPSSLDATLVRRRLRHVVQRNTATHKRALLGWCLACAPQMPLMLTPFPNVTLYYSLYRAISHYRALGGASAMRDAFANPESQMLQRAAEDLLREGGDSHHHHHHTGQGLLRAVRIGRSRGGRTRLGEMEPQQRLEALLQRVGVQGMSAAHALQWKEAEVEEEQEGSEQQPRERHPVVVMVRSQALDDVVKPLERWHTPLGDDVLPTLARSTLHPDLSGLDEHLARVRRMALEYEAKRDQQHGRVRQSTASGAPASDGKKQQADGGEQQQQAGSVASGRAEEREGNGRGRHAALAAMTWQGGRGYGTAGAMWQARDSAGLGHAQQGPQCANVPSSDGRVRHMSVCTFAQQGSRIGQQAAVLVGV